MIRATVRILLAPEQRTDAMKILAAAVERTRVGPGCITCRLYQDVLEPGALLMEEAWRSEQELERHLRSDYYRNVLLVTEMALEPPEFNFSTIASTWGMELVEKARNVRRENHRPLAGGQ